MLSCKFGHISSLFMCDCGLLIQTKFAGSFCQSISFTFDSDFEGGGKYFFTAVKAGDTIIFATEEEPERTSWVTVLYRSTGQSHKPQPPAQKSKPSNNQLMKLQGGSNSLFLCPNKRSETF